MLCRTPLIIGLIAATTFPLAAAERSASSPSDAKSSSVSSTTPTSGKPGASDAGSAKDPAASYRAATNRGQLGRPGTGREQGLDQPANSVMPGRRGGREVDINAPRIKEGPATPVTTPAPAPAPVSPVAPEVKITRPEPARPETVTQPVKPSPVLVQQPTQPRPADPRRPSSVPVSEPSVVVKAGKDESTQEKPAQPAGQSPRTQQQREPAVVVQNRGQNRPQNQQSQPPAPTTTVVRQPVDPRLDPRNTDPRFSGSQDFSTRFPGDSRQGPSVQSAQPAQQQVQQPRPAQVVTVSRNVGELRQAAATRQEQHVQHAATPVYYPPTYRRAAHRVIYGPVYPVYVSSPWDCDPWYGSPFGYPTSYWISGNDWQRRSYAFGYSGYTSYAFSGDGFFFYSGPVYYHPVYYSYSPCPPVYYYPCHRSWSRHHHDHLGLSYRWSVTTEPHISNVVAHTVD